MKVQFELTIDEETNEPKIVFRHYDRSSDLNQRMLGLFIKNAKKRGLKLVNPNGHLEVGTDKSWENYEIIIESTKKKYGSFDWNHFFYKVQLYSDAKERVNKKIEFITKYSGYINAGLIGNKEAQKVVVKKYRKEINHRAGQHHQVWEIIVTDFKEVTSVEKNDLIELYFKKQQQR